MKFMKLGSKPNIFETRDNVTTVASELVSDICVEVDGHKFLLHKFPLLSKSEYLNKTLKGGSKCKDDMINEVHDSVIVLCEFPGSVESFEMCAKFCYGITFTLNAINVSAVRCGAEYLEMTEAIEKSNLIFKLEVFFNSSILRGWKDSILCLQHSKSLVPWAEDLKLLSRCVDSISCKTAVDPSMVDWSFTYTRPFPCFLHPSDIECSSSPPPPPPAASNGTTHTSHRHYHQHQPVPKDWWVEDICNLEIALYSRVMVAVKAKGAPWHEVGEALQVYAGRWLHGVSKEHTTDVPDSTIPRMMRINGGLSSADSFVETSSKQRAILESLVSLLPSEKGSSSCSFLLRLLKSATILNASQSSKLELAHRIGLQLEEASLQDLIIPSASYTDDSLYDVDLVQLILEHYLTQEQRLGTPTSPIQSHPASPSQLSCVAKLIDGYLVEIARDPNLHLLKFVQIAESIPDFARPLHDGLYTAIDMYLKEHPGMSKSDRKRICKLMDCKKLSMDACIHACQNDRLPLRVVVQVLFFEQVQSAMSGGLVDLPENIRALLPHSQKLALPESANGSMSSGRTVEEDDNNNNNNNDSNKSSNWGAVDEDFNLHKGGGDSVANNSQEDGFNLHTVDSSPIKNTGSKTGFPRFRPTKLLNRLFPGLLLASSDYNSKKPMKLGSLPGKRTNPYSIP